MVRKVKNKMLNNLMTSISLFIYKKVAYFYQHIKPKPARKHIDDMRRIIRGGDVVLLRNNFFERIFPGYWSHVGVYIGNDRMIQSRGNGVHYISLYEFLTAARALVVRPKLNSDEIEQAIKKAHTYIGKSFDFRFNFTDNKKISCVELIFILYRKPLGLRLHRLFWKRVFLPDDLLSNNFSIVFDTDKVCISK